MFQDIDESKVRSTAAASIEAADSNVATVRTRLVRLNLDAIDPSAPAAGAGRRVRLNLFPGLDPEIQETRARWGVSSGSFQWFGGPAGDPASDVVLSVVDGRVSGSLALRGGFFQVRHVESDVHQISEVVFDRSQPIDDAIPPPVALPPGPAPQKPVGPKMAAAAGDPVVDILVVYTPEARRKAGGSKAIQDRIQLAIAEANASFLNSQAAIEFRLVGVSETPISGTQAPTSSFLNQVTQSEPSIQALRNYYGADLVSVWVENTAGGVIGIGWLNPGPPTSFSSVAYGVVAVAYSNGPYYTFSHEAGHNLGANHDRAHAGSQGAFPYSYGYRYDPNPGGGFYTVMAYSSGCGGCSASNRWSNPNVLIDGVPTGRPQGAADAADNASTLSQIAPSAALFRATVKPPLNRPPAATDQNLAVASSKPAAITLAGSDADGHAVFFDIVTQPAHGALTGSGANWTYTSASGYAGPDAFDFQVRDHLGGFDVGTVSLTVKASSLSPPAVSLASPSGGPFTAPATITLVAAATDSDGIDRVDFLAAGSLIGSATSTTSSFTFQWKNVSQGVYSVTAAAYDKQGAVATSNAVTVSVAASQTSPTGYTTRMGRLYYAFDEGSGSTVRDRIGANHGVVAGAASWVSPGLKGGYVNSKASSFNGNKLSALSGDAFTMIWVGKLEAANAYQTLFSMGDATGANVQVRYYKPNGHLYLTLNNNAANAFNASSLLGKNVMVAVRCSGKACTWRVGGAGPWMKGNVGTRAAAAPLLQVGIDSNRWYPLITSTSALFWVYADALTDAELNANFQFAGATLSARSTALEGYAPSGPNAKPVAQDQNLTTSYETALGITLSATDADADPLAYAVISGPSHGALSGSAPNLTYAPANGYSGPDAFTFQADDGQGGVGAARVSITVGAASNKPPSVSLRAPSGGPFTPAAAISLNATASDGDGRVERVEFYANGVLIGSATSATTAFSFNWTSVASGAYSVFARAIDDQGARTDSAPVAVSVGSATGGSGGSYTTRAGQLYYAFDDRSGSTVRDYFGGRNGKIGGAAAWKSPGLKGGYVDSGMSSFSGKKLSAASGDAFTIIWVGQLGAGTAYQTLFSMADGSNVNVQVRYNRPNGGLYVTLNDNLTNYYNASALSGKNVMITVRCAGRACNWRVGSNTDWLTGNVGTGLAAAPLFQVGADAKRWYPLAQSTSALFWVYNDALTDEEVEANFQFAGSTLAARGGALAGYVRGVSNSKPVPESPTITISQDQYAFVYVRGADADKDTLTFKLISGPIYGTLKATKYAYYYYEPPKGWTGTDRVEYEVRDGRGGVSIGVVTIIVRPHEGSTSSIHTADELQEKLYSARPGEVVLLAPGVYKANGVFVTSDWGLNGTESHPIVFRSLDAANPATIENGILLQGSSWIRFESLRFTKPVYHNVNMYPIAGHPSHDLTFDGNYFESQKSLVMAANLKITRSDNVDVRNSTFSGWGDEAIDTIGLWGGVIENNKFLGKPGFAQRCGLQLKGDTRDVIVRNNFFRDAGQRVVQIGGGTGADFFREPPRFEAQRIEVVGNRIVGGNACFSLATQTDSHIHHNTCYLPTVWIARLLNENFKLEPNQKGRFDHNVFVYNSKINLEFVNMAIAGGMDVKSFVFDNNAYFQTDGNSSLLPRLPVKETNMIDQIDPKIVDAGLESMRVGSTNPIFQGVGADAVNPVQ